MVISRCILHNLQGRQGDCPWFQVHCSHCTRSITPHGPAFTNLPTFRHLVALKLIAKPAGRSIAYALQSGCERHALHHSQNAIPRQYLLKPSGEHKQAKLNLCARTIAVRAQAELCAPQALQVIRHAAVKHHYVPKLSPVSRVVIKVLPHAAGVVPEGVADAPREEQRDVWVQRRRPVGLREHFPRVFAGLCNEQQRLEWSVERGTMPSD